MEKRSSKRLFRGGGVIISGSFLAVLLVLFVPVLCWSADRLVVQDNTTAKTFVVTEDGRIGVGAQTPIYTLDVSNRGVSRSSLHFSLNGTDTGGWITSVLDNNFWLSSGAMFEASAGGWIQKSPDGKAVMVGSGVNGYRVVTASGGTVGQPLSNPVVRFQIDYSGNVGLGIAPTHPFHLAGGAYSDGASWINGSSREYKDNIRELTTEEAVSAFEKLNPVAFTYRTGGGDQHIGFIAEEVPNLVATKDRKGLSPMDIVAVLTKVVQEKSQLVERQQNTIEKLERALEAMEKRLSSLEKQ